MIEARIMEDGTIWMLVTTRGGNDPEGTGGCVVPALGGSGCRWIQYLGHGSVARWRMARDFWNARGVAA